VAGLIFVSDGFREPLIGRIGPHAEVAPRDTQSSVSSGYVAVRSGIPSEIGGHFRAQANFSVRSSFFNADSALSASDLLAKAWRQAREEEG
jgi:hypothetical protein